MTCGDTEAGIAGGEHSRSNEQRRERYGPGKSRLLSLDREQRQNREKSSIKIKAWAER